MQFKHTIIGAGPVGLTLALHFKKFKIPFALIEAQKSLTSHPSAHYVNMRSREIFEQLYDVNHLIDQTCEPIENFRHFTYTRRIGEQPFHQSDQLNVFHQIQNYSFKKPVHLPQSELVNLLYRNLEDQQTIYFNKRVKSLQLGNPIEITLQDGEKILSEYVYGCDGLNGVTRDSLGINLVGQRDIQSFINLHFESHQLAQQIRQYNSMLTFIYNSDVTAVLISHQLRTGTFNIQIPVDLIMPNIEWNLINDKTLLTHIINSTVLTKLTDINIKHVGIWRMGAVVASKYYKGNVVLVGDAAHSVPPAGGFGMNIGIQDAHNLAHNIINKRSLSQYSTERKQSAMSLLNVAIKYYEKSLKISRTIGYDYNHLKTYKGIMKYLPSNTIYRSGVKFAASFIETDFFRKRATRALQQMDSNEGMIPLIFPKEETEIQYGSKGLLVPNCEVIISNNKVRLRHYLHTLQIQQPNKEFILYIATPPEQPMPKQAIHIQLINQDGPLHPGIIKVRSDLHIQE